MNPLFATLHTNRALLAAIFAGLLAFPGASVVSEPITKAREKRPNGFVTPTLGTYPATTVALSGDTTVAPSATPTGTTRMTVSALTDFKGKLEGNPTTGVVRVTDAHPAGTYVVTVKAFDPGGASATATFNLTVRNSEACNPPTFAAATNFGAGSSPSSVAVGDFNRDGIQDLAVANSSSSNISILLGNGSGSFNAATNFGAGGSPASVAVGDFNRDGIQDLVAANPSSGTISILLGDGSGGFSAPTSFGADAFPSFVIVGDFNSDGKPDLAVLPQNGAGVSILLGDGAGNFGAPTHFSGGSNALNLAVGDFNRDGKQDLAITELAQSRVAILLGDGAGSFGAPTYFSTGTQVQFIAVGDFNGDGSQDLVVGATTPGGALRILLGDGFGGFGAPINVTAGGVSFRSMAVGDFNGDGSQDIALTDPSTRLVVVRLGDGAGNFGAPINFSTGGLSTGDNPVSIAVGDFNGDGRQDLVTANSGSANASILLENCPVTFGNYPDTSIPLSTDTTVTPDAMPANITSMTVSSSTDFKGKLEGDPATGVVRVTDAHPAGTHAVTVTGLSNTGVKTSTTFNLTVTTPGPVCTPVSFAAPNNTAAGTVPRHIAIGDFNRDGKQDLVTANNSSNDISVLLGDGAGHMGAATNFSTGANSHPFWVAVGDLNGDGKQDLVVANTTSNNVSVFLDNGAGGFNGPTNFAIGASTGPLWVEVGDFNGDGKQDLATANSGSSNVSILLGDGAGNFGAPTNFPVGGRPYSAAIGDFNRDGKLDIVTANYTTNNVSILLGDGAGHLSAPTSVAAGRYSDSVAVGDFNGDGKQDLAVTSYFDHGIYILLGNGNGSFGAATYFYTAEVPFSVAVGDFNGDGKQDLTFGTQDYQNAVSILSGDGTGNFSALINVRAGGFPIWVAVGDFNGDGVQDLATSNYETGDVSVMLRNCNHAPVLDPGKSPILIAESADAGPPMGMVGTPIYQLVDFALPPGQVDNVTDEDAAVLGMAVTATDSTNGIWFYSLDDGMTWDLMGLVTDNSARLLAADGTTRLYFQPNTNYSGTLPSAITFRAWDQTSGINGELANASSNGADTAFSTASDTASLIVTGANECMVCHKRTTTIALPCNGLDYRRHLDHGDPSAACPN